jgi:hypothetical protein
VELYLSETSSFSLREIKEELESTTVLKLGVCPKRGKKDLRDLFLTKKLQNNG